MCCISCLQISLCPSKHLPLVVSSNVSQPWKLRSQGDGTACWRSKGLGTGKQPWLCRERCDVNRSKRGCRSGSVRRTAAPVPLARALQRPGPSPWHSNTPAAWCGQEGAAQLFPGHSGAGNSVKSRRRGWVVCYSGEGEDGEGTGDGCTSTAAPLGLWAGDMPSPFCLP